jgi:hypothetical protein
VDETVQAIGGMFSPWKVKSTLKKRSTGTKAVFAINDGRYSVFGEVGGVIYPSPNQRPSGELKTGGFLLRLSLICK